MKNYSFNTSKLYIYFSIYQCVWPARWSSFLPSSISLVGSVTAEYRPMLQTSPEESSKLFWMAGICWNRFLYNRSHMMVSFNNCLDIKTICLYGNLIASCFELWTIKGEYTVWWPFSKKSFKTVKMVS